MAFSKEGSSRREDLQAINLKLEVSCIVEEDSCPAPSGGRETEEGGISGHGTFGCVGCSADVCVGPDAGPGHE
jgi:hypothetical protein